MKLKKIKKLNLIILILLFSFMFVSCSKVKAETNDNNILDLSSSNNINVIRYGNYFRTESYFGNNSELRVEIGAFDPTIDDDINVAKTILRETTNIIKRVEDYSQNFEARYNSNGEVINNIYYINNNINTKIEIHEELYYLLEKALYIKEMTNGFFDISIGHIIDEWKDILTIDIQSEKELNNKIQEIKSIEVNNDVDSIKLEIENNKYYVTIKEGVKLDLGGIAKGYAVDLVAKYLDDNNVTDYKINGGGSSLKYGPQRYSKNGPINDYYNIIVSNVYLEIPPFDGKNRSLGTYRYGSLLVKNTAVTTSGDTVQGNDLFGRRIHHIISPITKEPMTHNRILTIVHPDATLSDAMSTAFFSMSEEELNSFLLSDFVIDNNLTEFIIFKTEERVINNFENIIFEYNEKTWDYNKDKPKNPNEGDDILSKTTRDFIIISAIIIIATLGFVMYANAFKKIEGNVTHAIVAYNKNEELVKIDFVKRDIIKLEDQSDALGYPIINLEENTITVLGAKQPEYEDRREVVLKYDFDKRSVIIVKEDSPNNDCSKQGETTTGSISCLPNKVEVKFIAEKQEENGSDGIV